MPQFVKNLTVESGNLVITFDSGPPTQIPVTRFLDAASVPNLTISSLSLLTELAQVVIVIVNTLITAGILDEHLIDGFDMEYIKETLVNNLSAVDSE